MNIFDNVGDSCKLNRSTFTNVKRQTINFAPLVRPVVTSELNYKGNYNNLPYPNVIHKFSLFD